jgi:hypothetical protein
LIDICGGKHIFITEPGEQKPEDPCMAEKQQKLARAGLVAIALSYALTHSAIVLGLGIAGVITIIYAVCGYWGNMDDKVKLLMVSVALGFLLFSPKFIQRYTGVASNQ